MAGDQPEEQPADFLVRLAFDGVPAPARIRGEPFDDRADRGCSPGCRAVGSALQFFGGEPVWRALVLLVVRCCSCHGVVEAAAYGGSVGRAGFGMVGECGLRTPSRMSVVLLIELGVQDEIDGALGCGCSLDGGFRVVRQVSGPGFQIGGGVFDCGSTIPA